MKSPEVIVGVDGSPASDAALRWAAAEAARLDSELVVLHVFDWRLYGAASPIGAPFVTGVRELAEAIVHSAVSQARSLAPAASVRGEALLGTAGHILTAASENNALIVVGNRGRGGFSSLLLGSVSQQVATHATGPVVVVRGRADPSGPVVVGVDGSLAGDHALGVAFDEATVRGVGVRAVRAFTPTSLAWDPGLPPTPEDVEQRRQMEREDVVAAVEPWKHKFPGVDVKCVAVEGRPAEVLTGLSHSAQLVVVGTRGHGGFAGLLLGSVGLQLLHHAHCPVMIARHRADL
jgi:nucleotide-binding universal stress UspA family protein